MKINYRTYPILKLVETLIKKGEPRFDKLLHENLWYLPEHAKNPVAQVLGSLTDRPYSYTGEVFSFVSRSFESVKVLSQNFIKASNLATAKINTETLIKDYFTKCNGPQHVGSIVADKKFFIYEMTPYHLYICMFSENVTIYDGFDSEISSDGKLHFTRGFPPYLHHSLSYSLDKRKGVSDYSECDPVHEVTNLHKRYPQKHPFNVITRELLSYLFFIKHAEIETKLLKPGQKIKDEKDTEKVINETKSNFKYLNTTWYTTLVKSDGFSVRGHFRSQPKKENGNWIKEIIWVKEFQKTGYTAPARKIKQL